MLGGSGVGDDIAVTCGVNASLIKIWVEKVLVIGGLSFWNDI